MSEDLGILKQLFADNDPVTAEANARQVLEEWQWACTRILADCPRLERINDGDDLRQEIFLRVLQAIKRYHGEMPDLPLLLKIARGELATLYSKGARQLEHDALDQLAEPMLHRDAVLASNQIDYWLERGEKQGFLNPNDIRIIEWFRYHPKKRSWCDRGAQKECAVGLGMSHDKVRKRIERLQDKMREVRAGDFIGRLKFFAGQPDLENADLLLAETEDDLEWEAAHAAIILGYYYPKNLNLSEYLNMFQYCDQIVTGNGPLSSLATAYTCGFEMREQETWESIRKDRMKPRQIILYQTIYQLAERVLEPPPSRSAKRLSIRRLMVEMSRPEDWLAQIRKRVRRSQIEYPQ